MNACNLLSINSSTPGSSYQQGYHVTIVSIGGIAEIILKTVGGFSYVNGGWGVIL
jgi:hypothetical protein